MIYCKKEAMPQKKKKINAIFLDGNIHIPWNYEYNSGLSVVSSNGEVRLQKVFEEKPVSGKLL